MMFIPLHAKSGYSLGYGTASVEELVQSVATCYYDTFALTDRENLYGQVQFHNRCRISGARPICGIELLVQGETGRWSSPQGRSCWQQSARLVYYE